MYRRTALLLALLLSLLAACGGENNFQATDAPQFQVEGNGFIQLVMPPDDVRTRSQADIVMRNSGDGVLTINRLEFVDRPDRLVALGERGDSCEPDNGNDDCASGEVCLTASRTCTATGLPEAPFEIAPQLRNDLAFALLRGGNEMSCPEPTIEVPPEFQTRYCGAVVIETNADNDHGEVVQNGQATIYFLDPGASGAIEVMPSFLEFVNVQPGTTHSQTFSIQNSGMNDLEISTLGVEDNPAYFTISNTEGNIPPVVIPSGTAQQWEVELTIPEDATDYEVFTTLNILSSAGTAKIAIEVTSAAGSAPIIELDQSVLRFDGAASQTLTISNTGEATLAINGINVNPTGADAFYSYTLDGAAQSSVNIPKGESVELVVDFARPAGNEESSVGLLEIAHNDRNNGFVSEVTLLGDEGDVPIGRLHPSAFTFQAADGNNDSREFVVRNVGTAPLDITEVMWNFNVGSNAEFQISPTSGSVQPGGLLRGTVNFTGMNAAPDSGLAILESNNPTAMELLLSAQDSAQTPPEPVIEVLNQGALKTMAPINLSAASSTPNATNAIWTLLDRPASSTVFLDGVGEETSFTPDVAGTYTIALTISTGGTEGQVTTELTVE